MTEEVKQYLWAEFKFNNLPKYYKYFDTWIENLTENQILYYNAYSKGKKSPYANSKILKIGRLLGISDNAVRKLCKKYALSYKAKDI